MSTSWVTYAMGVDQMAVFVTEDARAVGWRGVEQKKAESFLREWCPKIKKRTPIAHAQYKFRRFEHGPPNNGPFGEDKKPKPFLHKKIANAPQKTPLLFGILGDGYSHSGNRPYGEKIGTWKRKFGAKIKIPIHDVGAFRDWACKMIKITSLHDPGKARGATERHESNMVGSGWYASCGGQMGWCAFDACVAIWQYWVLWTVTTNAQPQVPEGVARC